MLFSIPIGPETEKVVERLAAHSGRSKDETLRALFEKALEDAEDLHDAEQATLARQEGRETAISQQEMERLLGLGDCLSDIGAEDAIVPRFNAAISFYRTVHISPLTER